MFVAGWLLRALLKGKTAAQVEYGFWMVVLGAIGLYATLLLIMQITAALQR